MKSQVNRRFGRSMEVGVRAEAISPSDSTPVVICKMFACITTTVAANEGQVRLDDIPDVAPISTEEIRWWRAARGHQQIRLERRALMESNSSSTRVAWTWSDHLTTQEFRFSTFNL
jgi:hypothetical protein